MLLNNQFKFFDKEGNNINPDVRPNLVVSIIDPTGSGKNAAARAHTNVTGQIVQVEIVNGGIDYSTETYFEFIDLTLQNNIWVTDSSAVGITGGVITSFTIPVSNDNNDFPYPATYVFDNYFLPLVSAGLIESENVFIIEKVLDANGDVAYTYPRCEEYGPYPMSAVESNGLSAKITVEKFDTSTATIDVNRLDLIDNVDPIIAANLKIGMSVTGIGIPEDTFILDVNPVLGKIALTKNAEVYGTNLSFTFHTPHYLKIGSTVVFHSGPFNGSHIVTNVTDFTFSFDSSLTIPHTNTSATYNVLPKFEARIKSGSDEEWFLYTVQYNENYPTITKSQVLEIEFTNATLASVPDTFPTGNGEWIRTVHDTLEKKPLQLNYGLQSDIGGVYVGVIEIADVTFTYSDQVLFSSIVECEVESEDERLGLLLENFGADINQEEELILRDSDINEDNTNFILLNQKRKEMLLQGEQIWPYVGSYKGLVNIINWFGYYDIRIKEYFLNVNTEDVYYNKYRQVQIPFQLAEKGVHPESINLVPSKYYKKTNLFGLFYDIVKDSGNYDEFGVPVTEDAFAFTNEEVLIKLFALKKFLKEKFLPLNTRIVDIAGEGVYYERYAVNSWNDRNDRMLVQAGKDLNFTYDRRSQVVDLRQYDAEGGLLSPQITDRLNAYSTRYSIDDVIFGNPIIPTITYTQSSVAFGNQPATKLRMINSIYDEPYQTATDNISPLEWVNMSFGGNYYIEGVTVGCDYDNTLNGGFGKTYTEGLDVDFSQDGGITWNNLFNTGLFTKGIQTYLGGVHFAPVMATDIRITNATTGAPIVVTEFYATANVNGGGFMGEIPRVVFPGQAVQQARGEARVRAQKWDGTNWINISPVGGGYQVGDIITLSGGSYEVPIRLTVSNTSTGGSVNQLYVSATGLSQGSNYTSLPDTFGQAMVMRPVGSQYQMPHDATGFTIDKGNIAFEVEEVTLYDLGRSYSDYPEIKFQWNSMGGFIPTATLKVTQVQSPPSSYFDNKHAVTAYTDSPNIPVGALVNVGTTFDVAWDELPFAWRTFTGSNDASLKAWTLTLPGSTGELVAVEILSTGTDYNYSPTFKVNGGGGHNAVVRGQIAGGKLNIVEYTVSGVSSFSGSNDQLTLTPAIPTGGLRVITTNKIVKSLGLPDGTIIANIVGNDIFLTDYAGNSINTTVQVGDKIYVHQGVTVVNPGTGFTSDPLISVNGGHTKTTYTWSNIGRGDFYQMEWRAKLTQPTDHTRVYEYRSGISTIDDLINHQMVLPYTGLYTVELDVYDTNNNISNKIKKDIVDVYMPEADFAYISRNVDECKDTWDEFAQIIPPQDPTTHSVSPSVEPNHPDPISYSWDNAVGRWINITFNQTEWNDCDINWETLSVSNLSDVNNPSFPFCDDIEVIQISPEDVYEGGVIGYTDSTTFPVSSVNPTIIVQGQRVLPKLDPSYDPTDWIFIRRDGVIYQFEVLGTDYTVIGQTSIQLAQTPPLAFTSSPGTWEVLREIGGTIAVTGNYIYDENTNPKGFKIGEYLLLSKKNNTPVLSRRIVSAKSSTNINILNAASYPALNKKGAYGRIYKVRDNYTFNGRLNFTNTITGISPTGVGSVGGSAMASQLGTHIVYQTATSGIGAGAQFQVDINAIGSYISNAVITVLNYGAGYQVGDTITISGASLGATASGHNLTFVVTSTVLDCGVALIPSADTYESSLNSGQLLLNPMAISCDPINEIRPGFTKIKLKAYDGSTLLREQSFRSKHIYLSQSSTGFIHSVFGGDAIVIDIIGIDGQTISSLPNYITDVLTTYANPKVYLEYEYAEFTTRERWSSIPSGSAVYMDYNVFPPSAEFTSSTTFGSIYNSRHLNWFYDHGIVGNEYSLPIVNTGNWRGGLGTIITLDDSNNELYRTDTFFTACQQEFDEDYAKNHIGTRVQTWGNYEELRWDIFCGNTWNTLDFTESLWCNYKIKEVDTNGGIKFNEEPTFNFTKITGGMTPARQIAQAVQELNSSDNSGVSRFSYSPLHKYYDISCSHGFPPSIQDPSADIAVIKKNNGVTWFGGMSFALLWSFDGTTWTDWLTTFSTGAPGRIVDIAFNSNGDVYLLTDTPAQPVFYMPFGGTHFTQMAPMISSALPVAIDIDMYDNVWVTVHDGLWWLDSSLSTIYDMTYALSLDIGSAYKDVIVDNANGFVYVLCIAHFYQLQLNSNPAVVTVLNDVTPPIYTWAEDKCLGLFSNGDVFLLTYDGYGIYTSMGSFAFTPFSLSGSAYALYIDSNDTVFITGDNDFNFLKLIDPYGSAILENHQPEYCSPINPGSQCIMHDEVTGTTWFGPFHGSDGLMASSYSIGGDVAASQVSQVGLDTFTYPNEIFIVSAPMNLGDVFYGPMVGDDTYVTGVSPSPVGGYTSIVTLSKPVPKKGYFTANCGIINDHKNILTDVQGLHEGDLVVGDVISDANTHQSTVQQILVRDGMVREIVLDQQMGGSVLYGDYTIEWVTNVQAPITIPWISTYNTTQDLSIIATAKNPSVDNLGYLIGTNGVLFTIPGDDTVVSPTSHTFPIGNFYSWFYNSRIGAFEHGLQEFLTKYRFAQVYIDLGIDPYGSNGWYPAVSLPQPYSYTNDPIFVNYLNAKAQAERLPYEKSIGGSYIWEEARIGKYTSKLPSGSSVLLSADASDIVGKTSYLWKLIDGDTILAETTDSRLLWTFDYTGSFDVELSITDSNGNVKTEKKKSFLTIYEAAE